MRISQRLGADPLREFMRRNAIEVEFLEPAVQQSLYVAWHLGYLDLHKADNLAVNVFGMHPIEIWGDEYERVAWRDMHDDIDVSVDADRSRHRRQRRVA